VIGSELTLFILDQVSWGRRRRKDVSVRTKLRMLVSQHRRRGRRKLMGMSMTSLVNGESGTVSLQDQ
jgi:hypothetical protein